MTGKATGTRLFPSCSAVEDNAFPPKNLHGLFGGVGYFAKRTPSSDPVRPRSEKGAKKQIFYMPHIAVFRFFRDMAFFISRAEYPAGRVHGDSGDGLHPGEHSHTDAEHSHTDAEHPHTEAEHSHTDAEHPHTEAEHPHTDAEHSHTEAEHPHTEAEHSHTDAEHPHTDAEHPHLNGNRMKIRFYQSSFIHYPFNLI